MNNSRSYKKKATNESSPRTFDFRRRMARENATNPADTNGRNFRSYDDEESRYATASHGPVRRENERTSSNGRVYAASKPTVVLQRPRKYSKHEIADVPVMPTGTNAARQTDASYRQLFECVESVINSVTPATISAGAVVFLDLLVEADARDRSNTIDVITDYIVQTAVDRTALSTMYATFCAEVSKRAAEHSRKTVRNYSLPGVFKSKLIGSCLRNLARAGLLDSEFRRTYTDFGARRGTYDDRRDREEVVDADERVRTLGTCRFVGHLYVTNAFEMFGDVASMVDTLMSSSGDDHSLECVCVLLSIVGPAIERVERFSSADVYRRLHHAAIAGYADNTLPVRTVRMINEVVCLRNRGWMARRPADLPDDFIEEHQNRFTDNLDRESRYRESVDSSAVTWKIYTVTVFPET